MLDLAAELEEWCRAGREFAVATLVAAGGSAPRRPGAALAVDAQGTALGSVSGGCVEGAVYELCRQALATGRPLSERFGYADADGLAVGLTCGGSVTVLVTPVPAHAPARPVLQAALAAAAGGQAAALARVAAGPDPLPQGALFLGTGGRPVGGLGLGAALDRAAAAAAGDALDAGRTGILRLGAAGGLCGRPLSLFVECSLPPPRMLVFGAADFAAALVRAGAFLGYRVTVCDARPVFATAARFPEAAQVVADWPHRYLDAERARIDARTVVCVLTHEAKFDVPLLLRALRLPVAYVGALGSRRTHADRLRRLREAGATEEELARLRAPIGLDLGARTPEETALAIVAEIVALRYGGTGRPLTGTELPLHRARAGAP